jgi:hypothetical protein
MESKGIGVIGDVEHELLPGSLKSFPNWDGIIEFFPVQGLEPHEAIRQIINEGYLEGRQGLSTWRLAEDKLQEIILRIKDYNTSYCRVHDPKLILNKQIEG